jgi:L-alanine-DL-glutamate epimerase-like enolase superfamily enzyme
MKITDVRCRRLEGTAPLAAPFCESRLVRPLDVYEEFRDAEALREDHLPREEDGRLAVTGIFLFVDTDEGWSGVMGPIAPGAAWTALQMRGLLIGRDPLATQKIWDILYRAAVHGRQGVSMMAISAIDCALWDLKGKVFNAPVYRLLGGPTRDRLPVYASMLGFSLEPEQVAARAREFAELGYCGQKWFFRYGPASGREGLARNVELARTAREHAGRASLLMFDAWMGWDAAYTRQMIRQIEPCGPHWLEEPLPPGRIEELAEVTRTSGVPIAAGEHEYTRWGFQPLFSRRAVDVAQPDPIWAGGISEMMPICALASVHGIPVVPHAESFAAVVHLAASQPPGLCPMVEYLVKWNQGWQYFLVDPPRPQNGTIRPDDRPGLGIVIDETKVERQQELDPALPWNPPYR